MAAYSDIISIIGGAASNSYVTGPETDSFAALQSWGDAWLAKSESERTIAIVSACSWLETVDWEGTRCTPSTTDDSVAAGAVLASFWRVLRWRGRNAVR